MPARTSDSELNHYAKRSESFESHLKNFHAKRANDIAANGGKFYRLFSNWAKNILPLSKYYLSLCRLSQPRGAGRVTSLMEPEAAVPFVGHQPQKDVFNDVIFDTQISQI